MKNANFFLIKDYCLGDLLATLYILENLGRQLSTKFYVNIIEDFNIFDIFNFEHVKLNTKCLIDLKQTVKDNQINFCSKKHTNGFFPNRYHFVPVILNYFERIYGYNAIQSYPLILKKPHIDKKEITYVQFDGRTSSRQNRDMKVFQKLNILNNLSNWAFIGGNDTAKYLGDIADYELGTLKTITHKLSNAKEFVGCDSGISHLAGVLGLKSTIYILGNCYKCLNDYYSKSYVNCTTIQSIIKWI